MKTYGTRRRWTSASCSPPRPRSFGYERPKGFERDAEGRLTHSEFDRPDAVLRQYRRADPASPRSSTARRARLSIVPIWKRLAAGGGSMGAVMDGCAMHVSDPAGRDWVEARLSP